MRKKYKINPSVPVKENMYFGLFDDNCWDCKDKHSCNSCWKAKRYNEDIRRKQVKKNRKEVKEYEDYRSYQEEV